MEKSASEEVNNTWYKRKYASLTTDRTDSIKRRCGGGFNETARGNSKTRQAKAALIMHSV